MLDVEKQISAHITRAYVDRYNAHQRRTAKVDLVRFNGLN